MILWSDTLWLFPISPWPWPITGKAQIAKITENSRLEKAITFSWVNLLIQSSEKHPQMKTIDPLPQSWNSIEEEIILHHCSILLFAEWIFHNCAEYPIEHTRLNSNYQWWDLVNNTWSTVNVSNYCGSFQERQPTVMKHTRLFQDQFDDCIPTTLNRNNLEKSLSEFSPYNGPGCYRNISFTWLGHQEFISLILSEENASSSLPAWQRSGMLP